MGLAPLNLKGWIEEHRPRALDTFARWAEEGRVEMIGGAFYEPIVTAVPGWRGFPARR